jgi:cyclohexanecarboxyl-CoA dehydrogenase
MDFEFNEDQLALRSMVRSFARERLAEGYLERAAKAEFPWAQHQEVAQLGLLSLLAGPEWGGEENPDYLMPGIAMEEIAYADFNISNCMLPPLIITSILREFGSPAMQEEWMPGLVSGTRMVALGLTEPGSGSDAAAMRTTATRTEHGWRLNGEKTSVTAIPFAEGAVIFAKTDKTAGARGVSAFMVPLDSPGISMGPIQDFGWLPVGRGAISMQDVEIPYEALIGREGEGFRAVMSNFDFTRPLLALTGIGSAQASLDEAVEYVRSRITFGVPLAKNEGISFPLAEHTTYLDAARLICYRTLWKRNMGLPHTVDAAQSKWIGPLWATQAVHDCILMLGHYGYSTEYPHTQRMRDILAVQIADGTAQIQKIIIARDLFGRDFVPYETNRS